MKQILESLDPTIVFDNQEGQGIFLQGPHLILGLANCQSTITLLHAYKGNFVSLLRKIG